MRWRTKSLLLAGAGALLAATELKKWRDGLLSTMAPSTINRLCGCLCAALEQAAQHDKRIQNRDAWEVGLAQAGAGNRMASQISRRMRAPGAVADRQTILLRAPRRAYWCRQRLLRPRLVWPRSRQECLPWR